jgi:hypothetical protein
LDNTLSGTIHNMKKKLLSIYINTTPAPAVAIPAVGYYFSEPIFNSKEKRVFLLMLSDYVSALLFRHWQPVRQKVTGDLITDITNINI